MWTVLRETKRVPIKTQDLGSQLLSYSHQYTSLPCCFPLPQSSTVHSMTHSVLASFVLSVYSCLWSSRVTSCPNTTHQPFCSLVGLQIHCHYPTALSSASPFQSASSLVPLLFPSGLCSSNACRASLCPIVLCAPGPSRTLLVMSVNCSYLTRQSRRGSTVLSDMPNQFLIVWNCFVMLTLLPVL